MTIQYITLAANALLLAFNINLLYFCHRHLNDARRLRLDAEDLLARAQHYNAQILQTQRPLINASR